MTKRARELNVRPQAIIETYHEGKLPQKNSFVSLVSDHVQISAIKEAEDQDGVIIRAYETKNQREEVVLKAKFMEREETLHFSPCEIKTIKIPYDANRPIMEVNMLEL